MLHTKAMHSYERMRWTMDLAPLQQAKDLQKYEGAIQNQANQHWIAYRYMDDHYVKLDSLAAHAQRISRQQLNEELRRHPHTYGIRSLR